MTLVFDELSAGPGTHALIIGVEPSKTRESSFSAAVSAAHVADLLINLEIFDAPLRSVDLLASYSPFTESRYQAERTKKSYILEAPGAKNMQESFFKWKERCDVSGSNIALFYFVGPVVDSSPPVKLIIGGQEDNSEILVEFDDFWEIMRGSNATRQLFFIDGCPSGVRAEQTSGAEIGFIKQGREFRAQLNRACYHGRIWGGRALATRGHASCFSRALTEVFQQGSSISTPQLKTLLNSRFHLLMNQAGLSDPVDIAARFEGEFAFRYRHASKVEATDAGKTAAQYRGGAADDSARQVASGQHQPASVQGEPLQGKGTREEVGDEKPASGSGSGDPLLPDGALNQPNGTEIGSDGTLRQRTVSLGEELRSELDALYRERILRLTPRQRETLLLAGQGLSTAQVAARLGIAPVTASRHLAAAVGVLDAPDRPAAAGLLRKYGDKPDHEEPLPKSAKADIGERGWISPEPNTHFVSDDPEVERDELGRGPLAIALGRRLHRIWCRSNGIKVPGSTEKDGASLAAGEERAAFVLHLDAPWGGGKTSFANFLARVLNPFPFGAKAPANFLVGRAGSSNAVGTIFIDDPPADGKGGGDAADWPEEARRPWIIVPFNAWQAEHCAPPWWVFYQAIRKGCFRAVWREGTFAATLAQSRPLPRPFIEERVWNSARLWRRELWWRLRNPKVLIPLATGLVAGILALLLLQFDIISRDDGRAAFNLGNAAGLLFAAITVFGWLWGAAALFTESMTPGLDVLAERRNLGSGDPFERFRRHFARTMAAVKRPVMVIVDDLDRCRPDFVVDLVRGIQTLLRSPRVVFVILGDRDWIERAFEAHHDAMKKVNVGPEQTFGARFVEKAIQMSFILPEMPGARQDAYVRKVLIGRGAAATAPDAPAPPPQHVAQRLREDYREQVANAPTAEARKQAEEKLAEKYRPELQAVAEADAAVTADNEADGDKSAVAAKAAEQQTTKLIGEERALLAAVDERMGQALLHRLEPLARFFPANPRQIKRIVNAITMYTCVAYLQMDMDENDPRGLELAIWVIVMTEWPDSWRLLASCPELADILAADDPVAALGEMDEQRLPGSPKATLRELRRIRADARLLALITEEGPQRPRLKTASVRLFAELTPLYSRLRRLEEEERAAGMAAK